VTWDIIYFDSSVLPFVLERILADPDHPVRCEESSAHGGEHSYLLTTDRGGDLPPTRFHALPHLIEPIRTIIALNT
jgi:hypothetical protein